MHSHKAFTLIELLIVIAIIAILSVVVILVLNPAQLLQQSRDSNRVSDMATMNTALGIYNAGGGTSLGSSNVVYISIPDPTATSTAGDQCQGLGLPTLPATYSYQCAASSTFRLTDGTGWIPVNFKTLAGGSLLGQLPIDPINTSSSRNYYTYETNGNQYEVTSVMESQKYKPGGSNDVVTGDGGTLASVYEKGTKTGLEPLDYGDNSLVGYWAFDEGTSTIAYDSSGNNATGSWAGTQTGTNGYYSAGKIGNWAGSFDGSTDYVINNQTINTSIATVAAWIYLSALPTSTRYIAGFAQGNNAVLYDKDLLINSSGTIYFYVEGGPTSASAIPTNQWVYLVGVANGINDSLYINGVQVGSGIGIAFTGYSGPDILVGGHTGNGGYFSGLIDDVRIYNRALSAAEISAMYNGGK
jgi:prepilin-type N-terminal cleavage/methylation domain-containing protein